MMKFVKLNNAYNMTDRNSADWGYFCCAEPRANHGIEAYKGKSPLKIRSKKS